MTPPTQDTQTLLPSVLNEESLKELGLSTQDTSRILEASKALQDISPGNLHGYGKEAAGKTTSFSTQLLDKVRNADNLMDLYFKSVGRNSKLLLNVPPTPDGLFHDHDVRALEQFAAAREAAFARNLLDGARVRASGGTSPETVLDGDDDSFWQAARDARAGWLEFELPAPVAFDLIRLEEAIAHGQHIANHRVEVWQDDAWIPVSWGTTIGHARLDRFAPQRSGRLRVAIEFAYDTPRLSRVALYKTPDRHRPG